MRERATPSRRWSTYEFVCRSSPLAQQKEGYGIAKQVTTWFPTFRKEISFDEDRRDKTFICPICEEKVSYRAYCEFIPRFVPRKARSFQILGVSFILILSLIAVIVLGIGRTEPVIMTLFGILILVGFCGLMLGTLWLCVLFLRGRLYLKDRFAYHLDVESWGSHPTRWRIQEMADRLPEEVRS